MGNFRYSGTRRTVGGVSPTANHPRDETGNRGSPTQATMEVNPDDSNPRILGAFIESPQRGQGYIGELPGISSILQRNQGLNQISLDESREVWSTPEQQTPSERRRQRIEDTRIQFANIFDGARQAAEEFTRTSQELIASHRYSANEQAMLVQSRDRAMSAIAEANRMAQLYSQASDSFTRGQQSTVLVDNGNLTAWVKPESTNSSSTIRRMDYMSTPLIQR